MNEAGQDFVPQRRVYIVNPHAANDKWLRRTRLRRYLQKKLPGLIHDEMRDKESCIELARKLSLSHDIIVVIGGDGTVADVVQGILQSRRGQDICLGIIPFGSGNAFRKSFSIPKRLSQALKILDAGKTRDMDLIAFDDKVAAFSSVGATAAVTHLKARDRVQGLFGHLLAALKTINYRGHDVQIELIDGVEDDGRRFTRQLLKRHILDGIVNKTQYFGYGWKMAPKTRADDGWLDITLFQTSVAKYLLLAPLIYFGLFQETQEHYKARKVIFRGRDLLLQYNGEPFGPRDVVEMRVLPRALKVICPRK
jgi:diacylglycerol kinase family enzyme